MNQVGDAARGGTGATGVTAPCASEVLISSESRGWRGLLVAEHVKLPAEVDVPARAEHVLCLNLGSQLRLRRVLDGKIRQEQVTRGHIALTPAGTPVKWGSDREARLLYIGLEPQFVRRVAAETLGDDSGRVELVESFGARDPQLEHIGLALLSELRSEDLGGRLYAESLATQLAVHLLRNYSTLGRRPGMTRGAAGGLAAHKLRRATDYIDAHLDRDVPLAELAAVVETSPYHFARLFKQATEQTPHQYVLARRVESARALLAETDLPLAEVAFRLGFTDQSHFTATFKKLTGATPLAYREGR